MNKENELKVFKYDDPHEVCYVEYIDHTNCTHCLVGEIRSLQKEIKELKGD